MEKPPIDKPPRENVRHIFGGIPEHLLDQKRSPQENLVALRPSFQRAGIHLGENVVIANTTLKNIVKSVNSLFSPSNKDFSPEFEAMFGGVMIPQTPSLAELERAEQEKNMRITIADGVVIGEHGSLASDIHIGAGSIIGNHVDINFGVMLGARVRVGDGVFFGRRSSAGDRCIFENSVTVPPEKKIPMATLVQRTPTGGLMLVARVKKEVGL